ncbi:NUDIX domain-containing protein [Nonlabens marinus]|uniref:ADP-ribose pyrophosphatase n=1 Tax=Nonlabens marinus S1-08 TaxID=1454201 RepID=W8VRA4_9FLAO|nr:NUDIX hydrolase [Nonlabens marinus]BAO56164.1 ADP-ribose pyrophosphatase [Nonlabens marinus S1-08]
MKFEIENEKIAYSGFLKVLRADVIHEAVHNGDSIHATRECLERGDSVAVLIYEKDTDSFLFTRQFRYPSARRNNPWMLELVAGSIDGDEEGQVAARREVKEEIGFEIQDLEKVMTYFPSPGGCSEQITIYYAQVNSSQQVTKEGGKTEEKEDIELVRIKKDEAKKMLQKGAFNNSISIIGLQWFFLKKG